MKMAAKVRALLAKTVKNGCTPAEQYAATAKAREIVAKHRLKEAAFTWPAPPPKAQPRKAAKGAQRPPKAGKPGKAPRSRAKPAPRPAKRQTRGDEVVELLRRKNGATIAEMVTRLGLQPHSLRAIISVEGRKRGLTVELVGRAHYRIA